jgi:5-methyltetrahydropteroyltriglutamate--homocysteine methyltransferase
VLIKETNKLLPVAGVGSWPRPTWMKGRVFGTASQLDYPSFEVREKFEDCVRLTVQDQERLGLDVIVDGCQYHEGMTPFDYEVTLHHIPTRIGGTLPYGPPVPLPGWDKYSLITVVDELQWVRPIFGPVMETVSKWTTGPRKVTILSPPSQLILLHDQYYKDPEALAYAMAKVYNDELRDLVSRDLVDIIQFVELTAATTAAPYMSDVFNSAIEGIDCEIWLHACQGNAGDRFYIEGTTEFIFPKIYEFKADLLHIALGHQLRSGDLDFFRKYPPPPNLKIGAGVVDVKDPMPETVDELVARIERVLTVLPAEQVVLMPDCGWMNRRRDTVWDKNVALVEAANIVRERLQ